MSNSNLGKILERVIARIRKEEERTTEEKPPEISATSEISNPPKDSFLTRTPSITSNLPDSIYLKALTLNSLGDLDGIKEEIRSGNIIILRVGPLAESNIEDVKRAVAELFEFTKKTGGDIARLGEQRVVVTPSFVRIWRDKTIISTG